MTAFEIRDLTSLSKPPFKIYLSGFKKSSNLLSLNGIAELAINLPALVRARAAVIRGGKPRETATMPVIIG